MTISAHDLLHDAGLFQRAYPSWPHAEPEQSCAPSLYLVQVPGLPDACMDPDGLAALLASGARPGGLYDVSAPGRKAPLTLCKDYPEAGTWTVCQPGEAGVSEPVVVAEVKSSSKGESQC